MGWQSMGRSVSVVRKRLQCQVRGGGGFCQDVGSGEVTEK